MIQQESCQIHTISEELFKYLLNQQWKFSLYLATLIHTIFVCAVLNFSRVAVKMKSHTFFLPPEFLLPDFQSSNTLRNEAIAHTSVLLLFVQWDLGANLNLSKMK